MIAFSEHLSHNHSKVMGIFRTLGSWSLSVTAMLKNVDFFRVKRIQQSTAHVFTVWAHPRLALTQTSPLYISYFSEICPEMLCPGSTCSSSAIHQTFTDVVLMLVYRLRRWTNIKTTLGQCVFFCWNKTQGYDGSTICNPHNAEIFLSKP